MRQRRLRVISVGCSPAHADGGVAMTMNARTKAEIVRLRRADPYLPLIEIARRLGVERRTVRTTLLAAGLTPRQIVHEVTCARCGVRFRPPGGFDPRRTCAWYCPAHKWGRKGTP